MSIFQVLFYILYGLGTVSAVICPLILIYWLVDAAQFEFALTLLSWFQPIYMGVVSFIDTLFPLELNPLPYGGRSISLMPPVAAGVMGALFIGLTKAAYYIKLSERKVNTAQQNKKAKEAAKKAEQAFKVEQNETLRFRHILLFIQFPFREYPHLGQVFQQYEQYGGRELPGQPDSLFIGFGDVQMAMAFAIQSTKTLLDYYKQSKPSDPKPPVRLGLHPVWPDDKLDDGLNICETLFKYASANTVLFSQALKKVLQAKGIDEHYQHASVGVYLFPDNQNREVYKLELKLPAQTSSQQT